MKIVGVGVDIVENFDPTGPFGAKGVGEIGVVGSIPAIANAVLDALWEHGVRQFDMPAHPQKIWKLLQNQKSVAN